MKRNTPLKNNLSFSGNNLSTFIDYFSREKQRLIKSDQLKTSSSSPANSDVEIDGIGRIALVTKQVTDAEAKLKKHR